MLRVAEGLRDHLKALLRANSAHGRGSCRDDSLIRAAGRARHGSYARRGPGRRDRLSPAQIALIARTVQRTPEVMVKVLNRGGTGPRAVGRHISYLDRGGELEIETDDGEQLEGKGVDKELLEDWDLDLDEDRPTADLKPWGRVEGPEAGTEAPLLDAGGDAA